MDTLRSLAPDVALFGLLTTLALGPLAGGSYVVLQRAATPAPARRWFAFLAALGAVAICFALVAGVALLD